MKVLLVSEGKDEGAGALESLVRRTVPKIETCDFRKVSDKSVTPIVAKVKASSSGHCAGYWKRRMGNTTQ